MSLQDHGFDPFSMAVPRSLSLAKACKILGVSRRTVYYWIKDGRLQTYRTALGSQRVLTESVRSLWSTRT